MPVQRITKVCVTVLYSIHVCMHYVMHHVYAGILHSVNVLHTFVYWYKYTQASQYS